MTFTTASCHQASSCTIPAPGAKTPTTLHAQATAQSATATHPVSQTTKAKTTTPKTTKAKTTTPKTTKAKTAKQPAASQPATAITVKAVGKVSAATLSKPLAVSESVQLVTTTAATPSPTSPLTGIAPIVPGPLPTLNISSKLVSPGSAAGLFPTIAPGTAAPSTASTAPLAPSSSVSPAGTRTAQPAQALADDSSTLTAWFIAIAALALATVLATLTKLLPRRRRTKAKAPKTK